MIHLHSRSDLKQWRQGLNSNLTLGFVPTMGALHEGHLSLVKKALSSTDVVLVSIFINRLQFNNEDDFKNYPQTLEQDLRLLKAAGADAVWTPKDIDLYPPGPSMKIIEEDLSKTRCGASRPGHFDGVLTVVMKLFQLVRPTKAFFGEKDYQQLQLIQKMVKEFFLDIDITAAPTVREASGLAMSSRNSRLSPEEKELSPQLFKILKNSKTAQEAVRELEEKSFKVDYVEDIESRRFAAVWLGNVRLIDNVEL